ncbi:hypothetical protein BGY98DRAFT_517733 [Russula aff. rugulosa BPL654]|nr:hypothetical protein BGY98DRAFT_517733 [Russula aff. rugulosa BPL654]
MVLNPVFTSSTWPRSALLRQMGSSLSSTAQSFPSYTVLAHRSRKPRVPCRLSCQSLLYDSAMNLIVEADVLTRGLFVGHGAQDDGDRAGSSRAGPSDSGLNLSEEERRKVEDGRSSITRARNSRTLGCYTLASLPRESTGSAESISTPQRTSL